VHNYADLYELTVEQILPLERMAQKSADNLVKGWRIQKHPIRTCSLCPGNKICRRDCSKKLAKHYKNIDALRQTLMDLVLVDEIGEK
jgi:DNA ligase (NAD+)